MARRYGPGALSESVSVERKTQVSDGGGGFVETWLSVGTLWARVEEYGGQEAVIADRERGVVSYMVTVPADGLGGSLSTSDRLRWRGSVLNVRRAPNAGSALYRAIIAEEGVPT